MMMYLNRYLQGAGNGHVASGFSEGTFMLTGLQMPDPQISKKTLGVSVSIHAAHVSKDVCMVS